MRDWSGTLVGDRFAVGAAAGRGGMGQVYQGLDGQTGAAVAVKFMLFSDPDLNARFAREATVLSGVSHPAIVRYVAHGMAGEHPYLVTDWVDGVGLGDAVRDSPVAQEEALHIARRLAEALGHVHRLGLIHRDVKPSNVLYGGAIADRVMLIDFGIARGIDDMALTRLGQLVGSPGYFSPEQARGDALLDARSDVFALGCLLYLLLAGRPAFENGAHAAARLRVLFELPPPLRLLRPDLADPLVDLVERMMAYDPVMRPADGGVVADELAVVMRAPLSRPERTAPVRAEDVGNPAVGTDAPTVASGQRASTERASADTIVDRRRPADAPLPFLVVASPDEGHAPYAEVAAALSTALPRAELFPVASQCVVVRLESDTGGELDRAVEVVRSRYPRWPIVASDGTGSVGWAMVALTRALFDVVLDAPDTPAPIIVSRAAS